MKTYITGIYLLCLLASTALLTWTLASIPRHLLNLALPRLASPASPGVDTNALSSVLRELSLQDSFVRRRYIALYDALPERLSRCLPEPVPAAEVRANAAALVGQFGPAAEPAIPQLVKLLNDDLADANAANSLALLGPAAGKAVPALLEALKLEKPFAATALGATGDPAARPALESAALTGPSWLRHEAANALRKLDAAS